VADPTHTPSFSDHQERKKDNSVFNRLVIYVPYEVTEHLKIHPDLTSLLANQAIIKALANSRLPPGMSYCSIELLSYGQGAIKANVIKLYISPQMRRINICITAVKLRFLLRRVN
jgi:hypothetical protein